MTAVAERTDPAGVFNPAGPVIARHPSKLLSGLFGNVDPGRRLHVLDIGPALPETVDFFSRYHCRLHFVDLFNEPFVQEGAKPLSENELCGLFQERLAFPGDTRIDICLFGDFLNFLDDKALRAFDAAIRPLVHAKTMAHGFGVHHRAVKLEHRQYGIIDRETVSVRPRQGGKMAYHPHSQIEMAEHLSSFVFERGLLLESGKLEMVLRSKTGSIVSNASDS